MVDPILGVVLSVQRRRLDVDVLVGGIEVQVPNRCRLVSQGVSDRNALEIWRGDKVDVLTRIREQSHHRECNEGAHGSAIVVSRKTSIRRSEEPWDVEVRPKSRKSGPASVVILEHCQKCWLVSNIGDILIVKEVEALHIC